MRGKTGGATHEGGPHVELTPEQGIRQRYAWVTEAALSGTSPSPASRCGISRKTYYKWWGRFTEARSARQPLPDHSRQPHHPRYRVRKALRRRRLTLWQRTHRGPVRLRRLLQAGRIHSVPGPLCSDG